MALSITIFMLSTHAFNNFALIATMIVLKLINTAPTAGLKTIPIGASAPAASGMARILYPLPTISFESFSDTFFWISPITQQHLQDYFSQGPHQLFPWQHPFQHRLQYLGRLLRAQEHRLSHHPSWQPSSPVLLVL